jgi:hypothetical protein
MKPLTRLRRLEVNARLDGSLQSMTAAQLFGAYRDLIERGGGDEAFSASLEDDGEERLAHSVLAFTACRTASEFMALEP